MQYIGEHLLPGQIGRILLVLSLVSSLLATISYYKSASAGELALAESWKKMGRISFLADALSVLTIFALIFLIISGHYFEYYYAWNHSDVSLRPKYLLSSIWEGQEGSFLLWTFWQSMIGMVLIRTAKKWESPVMAVISFSQLCLASMILGIYVFGIKIGSSPFILTRQAFQDLPVFNRADYLSLPRFQDGNGLNQLLQNYWMVIHPPVLFLGFASTIVPFAFSIAGLWKKDFGGWTRQALPWSLFSGGILGLGIMMGAKWAYESLNFGGYWAWDPVENASLVPWLILVAGIHTQVVFNSTGHSLRATHFFFILSFLLVLYSTYLTRSGDLQDTSVHAFVDSGLNWQLRAFVLIFLLPSLALFIRRYRQVPHITKEENTWSREFWMFIGSLILFLSAMTIIVGTSLPVINKILGTRFAIGEDPEFAYNRVQIFVAILIGLLTAVTQYLKYRNTPRVIFGKKIALPTLVSLVLSLLITSLGGIHYDKYGIGFLVAIHLAVFGAVFSVVANGAYIWTGAKGKLRNAGASVAHLGFGMMLAGILISSSKKEVLSINMLNPLNFGEAKEKGVENLTLFQGIRTDMGSYWATFVRDSAAENGKKIYYHILMESKDGKEKFLLYPDIIKNTKGQEGYSNNPDSKHYWNRDIFSYISYSYKMQEGEDTAQYRDVSVRVKDTVFYSSGYMVLDTVLVNPPNSRVVFKSADTAIMAKLSVTTKENKRMTAEPYFYFRNMQIEQVPDTLISQGLSIRLSRIQEGKFDIGVKESVKMIPFIALKVLRFPYINLVWLGTLILITGFIMSMVRRINLL